jgi:hypothetical protein
LLALSAYAQTTAPARKLPPLLEKELRLHKGVAPRVVSFTDTMKAKQILAKSVRDTVGKELDSASVHDSAIVTFDSAVSLSHKVVLDSMLAELPEYQVTEEGIRFKYPSAMLVETQARIAPFDSTLLPQMEPVIKEPISYLDAYPFQRPLHGGRTYSSFIEAGLGVPVLPSVTADLSLYSSDRTELSVRGSFMNMLASYSAIRTTWNAAASSAFYFPDEVGDRSKRVPMLCIEASFGARTREIWQGNSSPLFTQSFTGLDAAFKAGETSGLLFNSKGGIANYSDDANKNISEFSSYIEFEGSREIAGNADNILAMKLRYISSGAVDLGDSAASSPPSAFIAKAFYSSKTNEPFQWDAGVQFVGGSDQSGSPSEFTPYVKIAHRFSEFFLAGASFDPEPGITTYKNLSNTNPFYSPVIALPYLDSTTNDPRFVVTEKIRLNLFGEYFLSLRDNVRGDVAYTEKHNDPVFVETKDSTGHSVFFVNPEDTRYFDLSVTSKLLLFRSDEFITDLHYTSATSIKDEKILPFVPSLNLQFGYVFNSLSEVLKPKAELRYLARPDRAIALVNLALSYPLSEQAALQLRINNLFGNASDYWTGYTEYPRQIVLSIRAAF